MDGERRRMRTRLLRAIGLAGVAGVAAGGAVLVRAERQRRATTPDDVRARLHERYRTASGEGSASGSGS